MRYQASGAESPAFVKKTILAAFGAVASGALATPALATGTPAGTTISNTATATYDLPAGGTGTVTSNTVTLKVDELIDVTVAWKDPGDVLGTAGGTSQVLSFTVTNGGNAPAAFTLGSIAALGGDDFDPTVTSIVLDTNGNGVYDAGVDTLYVPGSNDPTIAADGSITAFILSTLPASANDTNRARAELTAASKKGTGAPGTHTPDAFKVLLNFPVICWGDADDKGQQQQAANVARLLEIGHPNIRELRGVLAPDDYIDAEKLSPLTRRYLREAFHAVSAVQRSLKSKHALPP